MRKKRRQPTQPPQPTVQMPSSRPKRNAHANIISKPYIEPQTSNTSPNKHRNADMRVILDADELKNWIDSTGIHKFGVWSYLVGQKCEEFDEDIFKSGENNDIDLTNFFLCLDTNPNKIHKHIMNIDSDKTHIGKGIIVKSINEDYCCGKKVFILFDDLYKNELSGKTIIKNIEYLCNQFKRISHYPEDGICIKAKQKIKPGVETIINFKI